MACDVFSSSVRRTVALLVSPIASAASMDVLNDNKWESRCMIGHKSVDNPRRVSTEFRGEGGKGLEGAGNGKGCDIGCVLVLGGVPKDRAAITS